MKTQDVPDDSVLFVKLTRRQKECLYWAKHGKSSSVIGIILGISGRTVDEHIATACMRLGVQTRIQAIQRASALGELDETP